MKKITYMLAAGVLAFGVSAQAETVESSEYAVITIPVQTGASVYNLVGVSVLPIQNDATVASVFPDLNSNADVQTSNGGTSLTPEATSVAVGQAVWIKNATVSTIHALGYVPAETDPVSVSIDATVAPVSTPFAASWTLDKIDLSKDSVSNPRKANKVSIWHPDENRYHDYIYRTGTGWVAANNWTPAALPTIGAGQGVFVTVPASRLEEGTGTVEFSVPAAQ